MSTRQLVTRRKTDRALLARLAAERDGRRYKGTAIEQLDYWWSKVSLVEKLEFLRRIRIG
jgi:hypothetical protein